MATTFTLNGHAQTVDIHPETPLLWVLRDTLGLTGTKFGCGMALCGACTVQLNGNAVRSCITQVASVAGQAVTTIEGLSPNLAHPVQLAWIEEDVPQCGYCQSGQIMAAAALLAKTSKPTDADPCVHAHHGNAGRNLLVTPGKALAFAASKLATLPPNTGPAHCTRGPQRDLCGNRQAHSPATHPATGSRLSIFLPDR